MKSESLWYIFINASLINNFVLAYFLGICPFLGVSGKMETATKMGAAVTFVMIISSICAFGIHKMLTAINAPFLLLISYIVVIAATVQLVEMVIKKMSPPLFRSLGQFLPLITTNTAILDVALFHTPIRYIYFGSLAFAFGGGIGFTLALILMAGIREQLDFADVPKVVRGTVITLLIAGILSLTFMGFSGLGS